MLASQLILITVQTSYTTRAQENKWARCRSSYPLVEFLSEALLTWHQMWCSQINFWCLMFCGQIWC